MSVEIQMLVGMFGLLWVTVFAGFGWGIRILMDMNTKIGEMRTEMRTEFAKQSAELTAITKRLDSLESGVSARR